MQHILLQNAFIYKKRKEIEIPIGFIYDKHFGAWKSMKDGELLVENKNYPGGGTKKCDIETGEDQKGQ